MRELFKKLKGLVSSSSTNPPIGAMNGVWLITSNGLEQFKFKMGLVGSIDMEQSESSLSIFEKHGNVAVIKIHGAMMRNSDVFTRYFGITTYEDIVESIEMAEEDNEITNVIFFFDTQGGIAVGNEVAAKAIRDCSKPTSAYVTEACSAGYFLASQCKQIVLSELSIVGSIGTVVEIVDYSTWEESYGIKTYTITSSNAPKKRFDVKTSEGQEIVQGYLDTMASVFVDFVANGRGVSPAVVISDFGQGGVVIGVDAINAGMADTLGTLESLIDSFEKEHEVTPDQIQGAIAALNEGEREALMANLVPAPTVDEGELTRVASIMSIATEHGNVEGISALAEKAVAEKTSIAGFSKAVLDLKASAHQAFDGESHHQSPESVNSAKNGWAVAYKN